MTAAPFPRRLVDRSRRSPLARRARRQWQHWRYDRPGAAPMGHGRAPDFVGVGVQRAGTTWWFDLIVAHPGAGGPADGRKEQHHFDRFWQTPWTPADADLYCARFGLDDERVLGEWTPRYAFDPWALPLLASVAPSARILVLLRDPVDRMITGLTHQRRRGHLDVAAATDAFHRGLYAEQITRVQQAYPVGQILVLQYERCVLAPRAELVRTQAFLGLDPRPPDEAGLERRVYASTAPKVEVAPAAVDAARRAYVEDARRLAALVPDLDLDLWPSVSGVV